MLSAGDCVFLDCRRPYRHYTGDDLWQLRWAHFTARIWQPSTKNTVSAAASQLHPENTAPYTRRLEALYTLAASDNYVRDMQICEGLFALLTLLMQESWHPKLCALRAQSDRMCRRSRTILTCILPRRSRWTRWPSGFTSASFYLTRVFKEQFGLSVTSYLTQLRVTQAKRLLRFTDKSVENVAQNAG